MYVVINRPRGYTILIISIRFYLKIIQHAIQRFKYLYKSHIKLKIMINKKFKNVVEEMFSRNQFSR